LDLAGKPMIQHVYQRAVASGAQRVVVATDHQDIVNAVHRFKGEVVLTSPNHPSGTDRIAETAEILGMHDDTNIVNVQGDEPLIEPEIIRLTAENLHANPQANMATIATPISIKQDLFNPNIVKVVLDNNGFALYFSRAPIPWEREKFDSMSPPSEGATGLNSNTVFLRHVGIYGYQVRFLKTYIGLPQSLLEKAEALEQLRVLSHGYKIHVGVVSQLESVGVDTLADYLQVKAILDEKVNDSR